MTIKRKNLEITALVFWCAFIFFFSSIPNLSSGLEQDFILRKIAHVSEFFVLAVLIWFVVKRKEKGRAMTVLIASTFAIDYAILDEIHQLFVFGRSGNVTDVAIDCIGVFVAALVLLVIRRQNKRTASRAVL